MALERGKFGIEYIRRPTEPDTPWLGRVMLVIIFIALVSFIWSICGKVSASREEKALAEKMTDPSGVTIASPPVVITEDITPAESPPPMTENAKDRARPKVVRTLLMRLDEARKKKDLEMEVSTLEQLRAQKEGIADLDVHLAKRLSDLNWRWLFRRKNAQWVNDYVVRSGDSAGRIATEHGSTLASLRKLNEGIELNKIKVGQHLSVLDHPRFILVVHKSIHCLDLKLNGKFFKRYPILKDIISPEAKIDAVGKIRDFIARYDITLEDSDRAELEMLIPLKAAAEILEH